MTLYLLNARPQGQGLLAEGYVEKIPLIGKVTVQVLVAPAVLDQVAKWIEKKGTPN